MAFPRSPFPNKPTMPNPSPTTFPEINRAAEYPTPELVDHWFEFHAPTPDQVIGYQDLRSAGNVLARRILTLCPAGPDRTAAIRKVREAVMTANAAIACGGR